jgi:hypothetical protein
MTQYSAIYFSGNEAPDILETLRDSAKRYIADDEAKTNPVGNWKTLITPWMITDSGAYKYSRRPDVEKVDSFFDELIRRQKKDSHDFDSSLRDYVNALSTYDCMDVHYKNAYDFHSKFYDERVAVNLVQPFNTALNFGNSLDGAFFSTMEGTIIKNRLIEEQNARMITLTKEVKTVFVEQACRRDLQALVASDPDLFLKLKSNQPLTGASGDLADWFQTSILDLHNGQPHDIALKIGPGIISPLTPKKGNNNNTSNNINNQQPQQQQQQQQGAGKRNHQQSYVGGPQQRPQTPIQQGNQKRPKHNPKALVINPGKPKAALGTTVASKSYVTPGQKSLFLF